MTKNTTEENVHSQPNGLWIISSANLAFIVGKLTGGRLGVIDLTTPNHTLKIMLNHVV